MKNKIEIVTAYILMSYPDTVPYDKMKSERRILADDLSLYNTAHVVYQPKGMTEQELHRDGLQIYKDIYSPKNIIRRRPDSKNIRPAYYLFRFTYRKYDKLTDLISRLVIYEKTGLLTEKLTEII